MNLQRTSSKDDALHGKTRREFLALVGAASAALFAGSASRTFDSKAFAAPASADSDTIEVTDFGDVTVTIPAHANKIAALAGTTFDPILFLGQVDRVKAAMNISMNEWMTEIYPFMNSLNITKVENAQKPNVEELVNLGIDLVLYWPGDDFADQRAQIEQVGIPVVGAHTSGVKFSTVQEFKDLISREIRLYAEILGEGTQDKAEEWISYTLGKLDYVASRTQDLPEDQIKLVHYVRKADDGTQVYGANTYPAVLVDIAGGRLDDLDTISGFKEMNMEDIITLNPDYVFMGWTDSTEGVLSNERWAGTKAVQEGHVYLSPCSLGSFWAYGAEVPLEALFLAKTLHPELFEDLDLIGEIQEFYRTFRGYELSAENAQRMLERKPPLGAEAGSASSDGGAKAQSAAAESRGSEK
ncbi:MAG: ABC transporter substrate-binding protein [Coriobacteriia bacterium]|nr:ABC transporter substrate-binding protein [Coriobacteriia bacterium]MBS5477633.1 ABC transporter substrate-binding protein [Coriobacteriia bacterium]